MDAQDDEDFSWSFIIQYPPLHQTNGLVDDILDIIGEIIASCWRMT
jgi:hypothetical protein